MADNYIRFYRFLEILHNETDEEHLLSMSELIQEMEQCTGEILDCRTIRGFVKALKKLDFDISDPNDNGKGYCLMERSYGEHEIRILMDSVMACHSITYDKTKKLLAKLEKLGSKYMMERLEKQLYIDSRSKTCNEQIFYNIDKISRAINANKKISFTYCHYNLEKQLVPRMQEGREKIYTVSPVFIILKQECYYLVCIGDKYDEPTHYRLDRMQMVNILEKEARRDLMEIEEFRGELNAAAYAKKCIKMYGGKDCRIVLKLKESLLDKVIDELGEDVELSPAEEGYFIASFTAKLSEGLKRWIREPSYNVEVLEPEALIADTIRDAERVIELYKNCKMV